MNIYQRLAAAFLVLIGFAICAVGCAGKQGGRAFAPPRATDVVSNVSNTISCSCFPVLQADSEGNVHLVWIDGANDLELFYSRWTGGNWTKPVSISGEGAVCVPASIVVERSGVVHVAWMMGDQYDCDIYCSHIVDGAWSPPTNISKQYGISQCPKLAMDTNGTLHVVWYDNVNGHLELFHAKRQGTKWSKSENTNLVTWEREDDPEMLPNFGFAADSRNQLHLVWVDIDGDFLRLFHSRWDGERWSQPKNISSRIENPTRVTLLCAESDDLHLTWQEHFSEVWYCRNSEDTWTEPTNLSGPDSGLPTMAISQIGQVYVAWTSLAKDFPQILVGRFDAGTWSKAVQITNDSIGALFPSVTVDASGEPHLAWMHLTPTNTDIHHRRGTSRVTGPAETDGPDAIRESAFIARGDVRALIAPTNPDDPPRRVTIVQPRGEFVKIRIATTNELLQRLLHTYRSVREQALKDFLAAPEQYAPPACFAAASVMFEFGDEEQSLFWYDVAEMRANSDNAKCGDAAANEVVSFLIDKFGAQFRKLIRSKWRHSVATINKAIEWDRQHERKYDQRWIALHGTDALSSYSLQFAPREDWNEIDERIRQETGNSVADVAQAAEKADSNHDGELNDEEMESFQTELTSLTGRRQLAQRYEIDGDTVTYQGHRIDDAYAASFQVLENPLYARDKARVYVMGNVISGANPESFVYLAGPYGKDDSTVYWGVVPMAVHDPDSFEVVYWEGDWLTYYEHYPQITQFSETTLSESIRFGGWLSPSILKLGLAYDQRSVIGLAWARDKQAWYFGPAEVKGADYPSFEVINAGSAKDRNQTYEGAFPTQAYTIEDYSKVIALEPENAAAYVLRGRLSNKAGDPDMAMRDFNEAIRVSRKDGTYYYERARAWLQEHEYDKAIADLNDAMKLNEWSPNAYNTLAWLLATCEDARYRDGVKAVEHATKACELTDWNNAVFLDTLGAAYAEAGDFDKAVDWSTKARDLVSASERADYQLRLDLYRRKKPYRESGKN